MTIPSVWNIRIIVKKIYVFNNHDLRKLMQAVEEFCELNNFSMKDSMNMSLVMEELFTNIVFYAFPKDTTHEINIEICKKNKELFIEVKDDGIAFNILEKPDPDLSKTIEDREIGGLGIHFVKTLMDNIEYKRSGDNNILKMKKIIEKK